MSKLGGALQVRADEKAFRQASEQLASVDPKLKRALTRRLGMIGRPMGQRVLRAGAMSLPQRGGLSARVASGKVSQSSVVPGHVPGLKLILRTQEGYSLPRMNDGMLRHPVYGHRKVWVSQQIRSGGFSDAFEAEAPTVRKAILDAMSDAVADLGKD